MIIRSLSDGLLRVKTGNSGMNNCIPADPHAQHTATALQNLIAGYEPSEPDLEHTEGEQ